MRKRGYGAVIALGLIAVAVGSLLTGCASNEPKGQQAFVMPAPPPEQGGEYVIQPGDSIDITFYYHPDNSQQNLLVRPDGKIYLPLIGEVQAGGLTAPQLNALITKLSSVNLRDPKVSVNVRAMNLNRIFVGGEVYKPGFVNYTAGLTAVQAAVQVGGWKDTANLEEVVLLQKVLENNNEYRPTKINLAKVVELGDVKADIVLGPSDVLVFPKTGIAKANVWMQQYIINMIPIRNLGVTVLMYAQFYGFNESPFALTPDPRYLFLSEPHKEALASAVYGVQERKGFVLILGEVGTGKTTLIRHLLGRFGPNIRSVFVFNPAVSFTELLQLMLRDLELPCPSMRRVEMIDTLNDYLLKEAAAGRYVVVIIDEAQHLSAAVLEEVRMLSNLETARGKLIQILLVGQPELGEKLGRPELRQLRQRISLVAELKPLSHADTVQYIAHRLEVAGRADGGIFSARALKVIHRASGGIPRLVNVLCDKALVLGYAAGHKVIKAKLIKEVLKDWKAFERPVVPNAARGRVRRMGRRRARVPAPRPLRRIAAAVAIGIIGAALIVMFAGRKDGDLIGRLWNGLLPTGASGTVVSRPPSPAPAAPEPASPGGGTSTAAPAPELPPRPELRSTEPRPGVEAPAVASTSQAPQDVSAPVSAPAAEKGPASTKGKARETVVGPGEVFSSVVARNYGRAELTLLDFVKTANPDVESIDVVHVGQRIKLPAFEPGALVHKRDGGARYRLHLMTVLDDQRSVLQKLRPALAKLGRQVELTPVALTQRETAYRVLVGDFTSPREAEAFYRDFRVPLGVNTQLWR